MEKEISEEQLNTKAEINDNNTGAKAEISDNNTGTKAPKTKKNYFQGTQSSFLAAWPVIIILFILGILAAFKGWSFPAAILIILFLFALVARIWGMFSCKKIKLKIKNYPGGLFPGDKFYSKVKITNDKFLPVIWLSMNFPLDKDPVVTPDEGTIRELSQVDKSEENNTLIKKVAEVRFPSFLWYEENEKTITWTAKRRGVFSNEGWTLATGDGLGLCQIETPLMRTKDKFEQFAVYPKLQEVSSEELVKNIWSGETGLKGITDDITVIRSSREYMPTDNSRFINWRLLARGEKLQVNTYEQILPGSIHLIIDAESFSAPILKEKDLDEIRKTILKAEKAEAELEDGDKDAEKEDIIVEPIRHLDELEDMLSVVASELVLLDERGVKCGITLPAGEDFDAVSLFGNSSELEDRLFALAAYKPLKLIYNDANEIVKVQEPDFDFETFAERAALINKVFFITYDEESAKKREVLKRLDPLSTIVITYEGEGSVSGFRTISINSLKKGEEQIAAKGGNDNE